ncbi:hypothetical protein PRK78_000713 [Emydomyces testavorans]|uniref:Uncharacterized protein n=1 Tax=Emydomyces testavorans TaxID=2070801 RepID=A0AAF0DB77_9EURO|nr:hypothetical protein PRK78_000713 [Emydomyces testavorans]
MTNAQRHADESTEQYSDCFKALTSATIAGLPEVLAASDKEAGADNEWADLRQTIPVHSLMKTDWQGTTRLGTQSFAFRASHSGRCAEHNCGSWTLHDWIQWEAIRCNLKLLMDYHDMRSLVTLSPMPNFPMIPSLIRDEHSIEVKAMDSLGG